MTDSYRRDLITAILNLAKGVISGVVNLKATYETILQGMSVLRAAKKKKTESFLKMKRGREKLKSKMELIASPPKLKLILDELQTAGQYHGNLNTQQQVVISDDNYQDEDEGRGAV